jgi:hypothetical protein
MRIAIPGTDPVEFEEHGPRTRREAWQQHVEWVQRLIAAQPQLESFYERMLDEQHCDYISGSFPWQHPPEGRPSDAEVEEAIDRCIARNRGPVDEDVLWRQVQRQFPGEDIPRKLFRSLVTGKRKRGRPPGS